MKNVRIILSLVMLGLISSCDNATDIIQKGEFNEAVAFQTVDDLQAALNEVYDRVSNENVIGFTSLFTDEVAIGNENGGQNLDDYSFFLNPNNAFVGGIWANNYTVINFANRVIAGAELVEVEAGSAEEAQKLAIVGQCRALRAFAHFQLLTYFSTDLKNDSALGVILMDFVPTVQQQLPRATNGEVFTLINSDLDFAASNIGTPTNYTLVTQDFITAFRARMAAYRGQFAQAGVFADQIITSGAYTLSTGTTYQNMWRDLVPGEGIFTLDRLPGKTAVNSLWFFNQPTLAGGAFLDMGRNLFNLLDEHPGDIRRTAFVSNTSIIAPDYETVDDYREADVLVIGKYPGIPGAALVNDIKIFRLSEMYFLKAEALASAGNLNGATNSVAAVLKEVRDARNKILPLPAYGSATEAWADILKERRIELCFEGHRYIDLKRLGTLANQSVDRYSRDCEFNGACTLLVSDYRFTMPIPTAELNGNVTIRSQQNPNY